MSKTWLITGASRGLGRTCAAAALDRGDRVTATARDTSSLDGLVAEHGDSVVPMELDVTDRDAAHDVVRRAHERFGRLDVVVNNAGYGHFGAVEELDPPGGYGTDWAGASARHSRPMNAYGFVREQAAARRGAAAPGDPAAAARALLKVVDADRPPLRVLFGAATPGAVDGIYRARLRTWQEWEQVSRNAQGETAGAST